VVIPEQPANGVLLAQGGRFGGWSLYVKPTYHYNFLGLKRFTVASGKGACARQGDGPVQPRL
jgi:hypothetical protein